MPGSVYDRVENGAAPPGAAHPDEGRERPDLERPAPAASHDARPGPATPTTAPAGTRSRRGPSTSDITAGIAAGLFSVPEGMAYAAVGGFSPAAGLYAGIAPAITGSLLTPSVLIITTLTSAIAVTSGTTVAHAHLNPANPAVVSALALSVGLAMAVYALVGAGRVLRRIPSAAMTGFSAGIAVQILAGGLSNATGFKGDSGHGQAWRIIDWGWNAAHWSTRSTEVAVGAIAVWGLIAAVRRVRRVALLASLVVMSVVVAIWHIKVPLAGSLGAIPHGIPTPAAPDWSAIPKLIPGACAIALVALAQAGGIATPQDVDGARARSTRNVLAQAAANLAAGAANAMPVGGSLSRTGVVVAAGARTRWAGVTAGSVLVLLVCTAGPELAKIPVPLIGGLIAAVGCELFAARARHARRLAAKSRFDAIVFLAMLVLTVQESPLVAVVVCVALAALPKAVRAMVDGTGDGDAKGKAAPAVAAVHHPTTRPATAED